MEFLWDGCWIFDFGSGVGLMVVVLFLVLLGFVEWNLVDYNLGFLRVVENWFYEL